MYSNMKSLAIPFIAGLEKLSAADYAGVMVSAGAAGSIDSVNWPEAFPYCPETSFFIARSDDYLALRYEVRCLDLRATVLEDNGRSWEDSCCEFFVSVDGKHYFNVETTCIGSVLMAYGDGRANRTVLPAEEVAKVIRRSSLEHKEYDLEGGPFEWSLDVLIPFELLGLSRDALSDPSPDAPLDSSPDAFPDSSPDAPCRFLRANFYKCADKTAHPHYVSWNPIETDKPDFHRPEFFGRLTF